MARDLRAAIGSDGRTISFRIKLQQTERPRLVANVTAMKQFYKGDYPALSHFMGAGEPCDVEKCPGKGIIGGQK